MTERAELVRAPQRDRSTVSAVGCAHGVRGPRCRESQRALPCVAAPPNPGECRLDQWRWGIDAPKVESTRSVLCAPPHAGTPNAERRPQSSVRPTCGELNK